MFRSSSTTRVSDEFIKNSSSSSSFTTSPSIIDGPGSVDGSGNPNHLPVYSPISHAAKKERSRLRSAENAVHFIPLVLVLCAIILWVFSNPVNVVQKADSVITRSEGLKAVGGVDIDGTQNNLLSHMELEDVDITRHPNGGKTTG